MLFPSGLDVEEFAAECLSLNRPEQLMNPRRW